MPFPKLRTDAVAQYPATKSIRFENQVVRFVDGGEQRYRDSSGALHQWEIRLDRLDESEMAALEQFFAGCQGRFASFAFTDPWDGQVYADCSFATDQIDLTSLDEMNGRTSLTVIENRA
jgi:hypothetical protein